MTVHNIQITATDNTKTAFANIERSLGALNAMGSKVTGTFAALIGGLSVGKVIEVSKEWQNLEITLKSVSAAGTDTKALLKSLADASSGTVGGVTSMVEAYRQLKLAGLDASTSTINSLKNLAAASGNDLGRTAELIGKALRGEFGKLDDFGIDVQNKFGQFVIKYQGQTQAIVSNSAQVVNEIIKLSNTNAAFADAAIAKSKTLDSQLNKLKGTVEAGIGASNLADSLADLVSKANQFFVSSGNITKAANSVADAINWITKNANTIITVLEILGTIFVAGKIVQGIKLLSGMMFSLGRTLTSLGYAAKDMGSTFGAAWTYIAAAWKSLATQLSGAAQPLAGIADSVFRFLFLPLAAIVKNIGTLFKNFAGPITAIVMTIVGAFDPLINALGTIYDKLKDIVGLKKELPAANPNVSAETFQRAGVAPSNVQGGRGNVNPAVVKPSRITGNQTGVEANPFLTNLLGGLTQAKAELAALQKVIAKTKDINILSLLFGEASSRAEKFGIVLQKPITLIDRDFKLAVDKANESTRQYTQETANSGLVLESFRNRVAQSVAELARQKVEYSDVTTTLAELNLELDREALNLAKQNTLLVDGASLQKMFNNELAQASNEYTKRAAALANSAYQQELFNNSIANSRLDVIEQTQRLGRLDAAYKAGTITLREYTDALKGIDDRMLGVDQLKAMAQATREQTRAEFERSKALRDSYTLYEEIQMVAEDSTKKAGDALTQNLTDAIRTGKGLLSSFKDFFNQILTDIANAIIKKQFVNPIVDSLSGLMSGKGGAGGGIASSIGNIFSGSTSVSGGLGDIWGKVTSWFSGLGFAEGGRPPVGQASIVGEAGPELFVPDSAGTIVPNGAMNQPIVVNLNLSAIDTQSGVEFLVQNRAVITGVVQQAFNRNAKNGFA